MSVIAGVVSPAEPAQLHSIIARMAAQMKRDARQEYDYLECPGAALARVAMVYDGGAAAQQGGVSLAVAGELVEDERLRSLLGSSDLNMDPDALGQGLLRVFREAGIGPLCGLNGLYSLAVWEETPRRLTLVTDRYGVCKLYVWHDGPRLFFASEMKAISVEPSFRREISPFSLAEFMVVRLNQDDRTFFEAIKLLPMASVIVFEDGRLTIKPYWDYSFFPAGGKEPTEAEALEELDHRFEQAIRRRIYPATGLLLTGGLDSRAVAGTLERCGAVVETTTAGVPKSQDVVHGADVARRLGFKHTVVPVPPDYLRTLASEYVWRTEGNQNLHGSWVIVEDAFLQEKGIQWVMTGLNGDGVSGKLWEPALASTEDLLPVFLSIYAGKDLPDEIQTLAKLMRPEYFDRVQADILAPMEQNCREAKGDYVLNCFDYVWFSQVIRRVVYGGDCFGSLARSLEPFFDNDLFDFFVELPPAMRMNGSLYKKMIVKRLPKVASAMYGNDDRPYWWTWAREEYRLARILARLERRLPNRWPRVARTLHGDPSRASILHNEWLRKYSMPFVRQTLNQPGSFSNYFNLEAVNQLLDEHQQGKRNTFRSIAALLTLALWMQRFCDNQPTSGLESIAAQRIKEH